MGGRRYKKDETIQIEALIEEGLTSREIAQKLGRSEAGIRNIRYRKGLIKKAESETKVLYQQRDNLRNAVKGLEEQRRTLYNDVESLKAEKEKLELIIGIDKLRLQQTLAQALTNLKMQRPDLFILSGQEQMAMLLGELLKRILA